jgi:hypothetical protein
MIVSFACLLLTGCLFRFVYPRLDTIAVWLVDRELGLSREQERRLAVQLEERLAWHRREQLPLWRDWMQAVRDDVAAQRMTAERHQEHRRRLVWLMREGAGGFVDVVAALVASLDDRQIARFLGRYDEATEELREELSGATADERLAERRRQAEERAEKWFGPLTPAQEEFLAAWSGEAIDWNADRLASRERWRAALAETLAARSDAAKLRADVERLLRRPESLRGPAYEKEIERYDSHLRALHLHLLGAATDEQRRHLLGEIDDWLDDLSALCGIGLHARR